MRPLVLALLLAFTPHATSRIAYEQFREHPHPQRECDEARAITSPSTAFVLAERCTLHGITLPAGNRVTTWAKKADAIDRAAAAPVSSFVVAARRRAKWHMFEHPMRVAFVSLSLTPILACGGDDAAQTAGESGSTTEGVQTSTDSTDPDSTGDGETTADPDTTTDTDPTEGTTVDSNTDATTSTTTSPDESSSTDAPSTCGDGVQEADEECDDGAANAEDAACLPSCEMATCGDGFVRAGVEACDEGAANDDEGACLETCVVATCGDGLVQDGVEGCDDANADDTDGCFADCTADPCGPQGAILRVDADAAGANDGSSWDDAYTSLHTALQSAGANDEIWIAEGRYTAVAANAPVAILHDCVDVIGGFEGTEQSRDERPVIPLPTLLDGDFANDDGGEGFADNAFQAVTADDVDDVLLDGLTISGGRAFAGGDASSGAGLFAVASTLSLRDVTFVGNVAEYRGGGAYADDSVLDLVRVAFIDNEADDAGGGLFHQYSTLSVAEGTFESNAVVGNVGSEWGGGLAILGSDFTISDSAFSGNSSTYNAGGLGVLHDPDFVAVITGTVFEDNSAQGEGGAMRTTSGIDMTGGELRNNDARNGAAIHSDAAPIALDSVVFADNTAFLNGGAVFAQTNAFTTQAVSVSDCTFTANTATYGGGGALYLIDHTLAVADSTFDANISLEYGGAVYFETTHAEPLAIDLADTSFIGNESTESSGGALSLDFYATGTAERLVFTGNTADGGGGAIDGGTDMFELVDSEFHDNSAIDGGGAIAGNPNIENSWFEGNASAVGGALSTASVVRGSVFLENTATERGGAVSGGDAYIDCDFIDNAVTGPTGSGGAVALDTPQEVFFDSCSFEGNTAPTNGGAIFTNETRLVVRNSAFHANASGVSGGAVHAERYNGHPIIASSTFYENIAPATGGIFVAASIQGGLASVVNIVAWGNGTDLTTNGNATATYLCTQSFVSLDEGNVFGIGDPIVVGAGGELFLDQAAPCVDAGDDDAADATYDALGLDWTELTTDPAGSEDADTVDMGVHYAVP